MGNVLHPCTCIDARGENLFSDPRLQRSNLKCGSNCARSSEQQDMLALGYSLGIYTHNPQSAIHIVHTAVDMVVPKSFPALCTPYVQVVHQPWKCTVHKSWKCLHRWSVQEVSKSCKKCFVSKSVSKSVLHNSCIITLSKKCPSWALSKLGPNLTHAHGYLVRLRFRLF